MHNSLGLVTIVAILAGTTAALGCTPNQPGKLQMGRTITIDTAGGAAHGSVNYGETGLLGDKEVVLTFDDGPVAGRTTAVLDALEHHCVRATFFPVGRMAMVRPDILRETLRRGHTIGGHTWSHPNLRRSGLSRARSDIQKGFAALEAVIGRRVAPLFRFPYLAESRRTLAYVKSQDIASISIDVDSGDTRRGYDVSRVTKSIMTNVRRRGRGILLFHDSKLVTVRALPQILDLLAKGNFRVVHLETTEPYRANPELVARYTRRLNGNAPAEASAASIAEPRPRAKPRRRTTVVPRSNRPISSRLNRTTTDWRQSVFESR